MRPTEERSIQGYWDGGDDRPDPLVAQSAPEFVGQLRALVQWSGLRLDEIEQLARANGDILPPSILSAALSHNTLPPEEVVVALVAAIGDDDEMVELWASVLWRLEDMEAAATMAAPHSAPSAGPGMIPYGAPHPPPMSMPGPGPSGGPRRYSGSALAQAVQKRRDKDSWTGLHRGFQKGLRATGLGAKFGRWPAPVAVGAAILVLIAGVTWAVSGGGDGENAAEPRSNPCCAGQASGATPSGLPSVEVLPSDLTIVLPPPPSGSTKASPTPRVSTTPPRNSPTPTQTTQMPVLNGNGSASCEHSETNWVIYVTVSATLTGATAGTDPQGQAGKSGDLQPLSVSGGGTSFSGNVRITLPDTEQADGTFQWKFSVSVAGAAAPVSDQDNVSYHCPA